jgi:hypothetical protein
MILYDMRYRGPMEYDKFALNILQYSNEINYMLKRELSVGNISSLQSLANNVDKAYHETVGRYDPDPTKETKGISEQLYYKLLEYKEC